VATKYVLSEPYLVYAEAPIVTGLLTASLVIEKLDGSIDLVLIPFQLYFGLKL
jgi:hypothetical protein